MPPAARPVVYVCTGKDCRKDRGRHQALLDAVDDVAEVRRVGCQKVCKGPVAGTRVDGRIEWFRRVRKRGRAALRHWLRTGGHDRLPPVLAERVVDKRRDRVR